MLIGDLAKKVGVATSKIRFYEARGIISAKRLGNGYRDYDERALAVLRFVHRARSLGFTLRDIALFLRSPRDRGRKARLRARLEAKLTELDAHIDQALARRAQIVEIIAELRGR
jgi:MerR family transcriptional regulator, copper efflux regulator